MANPQVPWLLMRPEDQALQMQKMALAGTGLDQSSINEMAAQAMPEKKPTQPKDMVVKPKAVAQAQAPMPITSMSETIKTTSAAPGIEQQAAEARMRLQKMQEDRLAKEEAGISDYDKEIQKYASQKRDIDWRPLAALVDQWAGGGNTLKAAEALAPESEEQRRQKLLAMKQGLQQMKSGLSKSQYDALKDQLDSYNAQMNTIAAEKRMQMSMMGKDATQDRLKSRDIDKDTMEYQKRVGDRIKILNNFSPIEGSLGFNVEEFDELTGTVNGKQVDAPGVKIPGLQAIYAATPEGERFRTKFQSLLNDTLRAYSGAAVTDSEAAKTLSRFATNPGSVRQSSFVAALKDFKKLLKEEVQDIGGGFRPEVLENFANQRARAAGSGALKKTEAPASNSGGLTPEEAAELKALEERLGQ